MTTKELLNKVFDGGGAVWTEGDEPHVYFRKVPKAARSLLGQCPVSEVIQELRERKQRLVAVQGWYSSNVMPATGAQSTVAYFLKDYCDWAKSLGLPPDLRLAKQLLAGISTPDGWVEGFMLTSDFVTIAEASRRCEPNRFQIGDIVFCDHYSTLSRLVVLEIAGIDLMVSVPALQSNPFWVCQSDCEVIECVEHRLGGEADLPPEKIAEGFCPCGCGRAMDKATGKYYPNRAFKPKQKHHNSEL